MLSEFVEKAVCLRVNDDISWNELVYILSSRPGLVSGKTVTGLLAEIATKEYNDSDGKPFRLGLRTLEHYLAAYHTKGLELFSPLELLEKMHVYVSI
ncbi:hypothetical protein [Zhaonella formicivorans]|uniref:hypothetical protein n=1 Tax=Zhaonella formicivorans TaxID=2528593 RepID=UPI0010D6ACA4|nr:hypothetical protein [Zhaonella formicivorans]